jgi:hypothetical protein
MSIPSILGILQKLVNPSKDKSLLSSREQSVNPFIFSSHVSQFSVSRGLFWSLWCPQKTAPFLPCASSLSLGPFAMRSFSHGMKPFEAHPCRPLWQDATFWSLCLTRISWPLSASTANFNGEFYREERVFDSRFNIDGKEHCGRTEGQL